MDTVTYPDPSVQERLAASFVGFRLSLMEKHKDFKEAIGGAPVGWAPTIRFTDGRGREVRRTVGWFSPRDFVAQLELADGLFEMNRGKFTAARARLDRIDAELGDTQAAPEAAYYAGAAVFLEGNRDMPALKQRWNELREKHPQSDWAIRAEVADDA